MLPVPLPLPAYIHPGLVADCGLTDYIPSSCAPRTTDNDGLWTSIAVVAEALRFQVTGDPEARTNAWDLFLGMKFLNDVRSEMIFLCVSGKPWFVYIAVCGFGFTMKST